MSRRVSKNGKALKLDPKNVRVHDDANKAMIKASLEELGAGRSILVDGTDTIIAGNGVYEQAQELGLKVRVVEAKPDELIAVKRADLKGKKSQRMALADNRTNETSRWEDAALAKLSEATPELLEGLWSDEQIAVIISAFDVDEAEMPQLSDGDRERYQQMTFILTDEQAGEVKRAMAAAKDAGPYVDTGNENGNGNALARIAEAYIGAG